MQRCIHGTSDEYRAWLVDGQSPAGSPDIVSVDVWNSAPRYERVK
jgi:hypothetical protein